MGVRVPHGWSLHAEDDCAGSGGRSRHLTSVDTVMVELVQLEEVRVETWCAASR